MLKYTFLLVTFTIFALADDRPVVKLRTGLVRGSYRTSRHDRQFIAFDGIPYAQPPIGDLRFKDPQPVASWTGVWDASTRYSCMQMDHEPKYLGVVQGSEDCLYLNVYSPNVNNEEATLDVIVFIHGGAFMFGQGDLYGPENLMDRDIVYVTINYRLGPLGFLSTEDEVVPGNNGLKDQVLALKWIQENIAQFGGNPESVTITGMSAGGASVHYHYLSPLSKGLFARGISLSGTALSNWALVEQPLARARGLGTTVGCGQLSTTDLVACLRQRSAKQITQAVKRFQPWLYNPYTPFGPVVEVTKNENTFLSDSPYTLMIQGQITDAPWLTSFTSHEGLYPAAEFLYKDEHLPYLEQHWTRLAPYILHYDGTVVRESFEDVAAKIKQHYLDGRPILRETFPELVQAIGDRLFVVDIEKAARLQAKVNKSPVYMYKFSYRGDHSISQYYSGTDDDLGSSHADDCMYITSPDSAWFSKYMESDGDKKLSEIMIDIWTSVAKTGKPKVPDTKWKAVSKKAKYTDAIRYLHIISPDNFSMEKAESLGQREFWDSLPIHENDYVSEDDITEDVTKDEL